MNNTHSRVLSYNFLSFLIIIGPENFRKEAIGEINLVPKYSVKHSC